MTVEISKLVNEIAAFIKFVESKKSFVESVMAKLEKNIIIVREQLEVYSVSKKATVPSNMQKKFPDVKQRLLSSLNNLIQKEVTEITRYVDQLSEFSAELRKISHKMEKLATNIKWSEHAHFFNAFYRLIEWSERSWKYFHLICLNLQKGLIDLTIDDAHSSTNLKFANAVDAIDKEYVFNNPVINMFQILKIDLSSRSKVYVKSSTGS